MLDFEQSKIIKEQIAKDNAHEFVRSLIMAYCTNTQRMSELLELIPKIAEIIPNYKLPSYHYKTTGCKRTGCIFCGFGITQDKQRFARLAEQEPKLCDYVMRGGEFSDSGMWQPSKDGLGYWFVLKWLNMHGNLGIGIPNWNYYHEKYGTEETDKYLEDN